MAPWSGCGPNYVKNILCHLHLSFLHYYLLITFFISASLITFCCNIYLCCNREKMVKLINLKLIYPHIRPPFKLDVNNAFFHGTLYEEVFMSQSPSFIDANFPAHVCRLHKALYGLKQSTRAWYQELSKFLLTSGFHNSKPDTSLFIYST